MIDNYLEFVKEQRRQGLLGARRYLAKSRRCKNDWEMGFYRGLSDAKSLEARHWRRLQKDMEQVIECCESNSPDEQARYIADRFY